MTATTVKHAHKHLIRRPVPMWKQIYIRYESPVAIACVVAYILLVIAKS